MWAVRHSHEAARAWLGLARFAAGKRLCAHVYRCGVGLVDSETDSIGAASTRSASTSETNHGTQATLGTAPGPFSFAVRHAAQGRPDPTAAPAEWRASRAADGRPTSRPSAGTAVSGRRDLRLARSSSGSKTASAGGSARSSRSCAMGEHQAGAAVFPRDRRRERWSDTAVPAQQGAAEKRRNDSNAAGAARGLNESTAETQIRAACRR